MITQIELEGHDTKITFSANSSRGFEQSVRSAVSTVVGAPIDSISFLHKLLAMIASASYKIGNSWSFMVSCCVQECHCMLFLTPDNDFRGEDQKISYDEIEESTAGMSGVQS